MKHLLLTSIVLTALSSCGSQAPGQGSSVSTEIASSSHARHYVLTATTNGGTVQSVNAASEIEFPLAIQGMANASGHRRAVLQIGDTFCAYTAYDTSAYIRQDGSCNTFTPNLPINVRANEVITLYLESVDSNNYTSVQADLEAFVVN